MAGRREHAAPMKVRVRWWATTLAIMSLMVTSAGTQNELAALAALAGLVAAGVYDARTPWSDGVPGPILRRVLAMLALTLLGLAGVLLAGGVTVVLYFLLA